MELVNLWANDQPHLYSEAFKIEATTFLAHTQYKLLRKKREQEILNEQQPKK